jgi:competence protein ComFC
MLSNLINTAHEIVSSVLNIVYPIYCGGCGKAGDTICKNCLDSFTKVEEGLTCPVCGRRVGAKIVCGECIQQARGFEEGYFGFYFEDKLREAIHSFKFHSRKDVGKRLVHIIEEKIASFSDRFDCILPIPVTEKRLRERGFNQSFIIGDEISKISGKPIYHSVLCKVKETMDQFSLHRDQRRKNVKGVFAARNAERVKAKRVLLVDDLFTTGYTAKEASRVLKKAGVRSTLFFALARTPS